MRPMHQANTMRLKPRKAILLGTSALVCLALAAPVMATDFVITSGSDMNGQLGDGDINGGHTVTVTGTIDTGTTADESGIETTGSNTITVSADGIIKTGGNGAAGIRNTGNDNTTTVSGSITITGRKGYGIINYGNTNTTTVSGSIKTTGESSDSILDNGNNNITSVYGSIITTGNYSDGIRKTGASNTTSISGTVSATGTDASALYNQSGAGNSFILDEGAVIIGDITAHETNSSVNKLTLNLGQGASYAYSVGGAGAGTRAGQWTFTDQEDGRTGVARLCCINVLMGFTV